MTPHRHHRRHRGSLTAPLAVLTLSLALVACGGSEGSDPTGRAGEPEETAAPGDPDPGSPDEVETLPDPSEVAPIGTFPVGRIHLDLVDDSRPTKEHGGEPEQDHRDLPTTVWYPAVDDGDGTRPVDGDAPLIVFGHGSTRLAEHYEATLTAWASAGYVVAAPDFPLSREGTPGGTDYGGVAEQTGDVSFVIDELLAAAPEADGTPIGIGDVVGVGGQSFGAITAIGVSVNAATADPRIRAFTAFAGMWFDLGAGDTVSLDAADVHGLLVHGDDDPTVPYEGSLKTQQLLGETTQILTIVDGGHDDGFFDGLGDPLSATITEVTTAFHDRWLKLDESAEDRLRSTAYASGGAVVLEPFEPRR